RAALDDYYDLVAHMLEIRPISDDPTGLPPKTVRMREVARALEREGQFCYPNLAVRYGPPGAEVKNRFGISQQNCTHCGECVIGCNLLAKNTLDLNYLAIAERLGADIGTECEVSRIEPRKAGGGYPITFTDHTRGEERALDGRSVFLCAGAVNSSELLLRCRDEHGTLPKLSARLGEGYSGNGDLLAFAFETREPFAPS